MSRFNARVSEVTIEMDGLHITTVTAPDANSEAAPDEAQVNDFHMSLFTAAEWIELSGLIETAIRQVTADATIRARSQAMSREVMQQALDALKSIEWHGSGSCWVMDVEKVESAEATLREALAQPAQPEPVADAYALADKVRTELDKQSCPGAYMNLAWEAIVKNHRDLIYAAPPAARKPLTDEQLRECFCSTNTTEPLSEGWPGLERFARAIEADHGITSD